MQPAVAGEYCGSVDVVLNKLLTSHFAYTASMVTEHPFAALLFVRAEDDMWVIVGVDNELQACIVTYGTDFRFAIDRRA